MARVRTPEESKDKSQIQPASGIKSFKNPRINTQILAAAETYELQAMQSKGSIVAAPLSEKF
jgi:hypothetical protein